MAGDWIKMTTGLRTHPKVVRMSSALRADRFRVIGGLFAVWSVFDTHSEDGELEGYTLEAMDEDLGWPGFSCAMQAIGWLEVSESGLLAPRFDEHNSASAKRRAQETERKRKAREADEAEAQRLRELSARDADEKRSREEKRRVKDNTPPPPATGGAFDTFWNEWPAHKRKVARKQCEAKWRTKGCDAIAEAVMASLRTAKASEDWTKAKGEFIPAPLVWLNQARWEAPTEAQQQQAAGKWDESRSSIERTGCLHDLGKWDEDAFQHGRGESFATYTARVREALEHGEGVPA